MLTRRRRWWLLGAGLVTLLWAGGRLLPHPGSIPATDGGARTVLAGRVIDARGEPIGGASLAASPEGKKGPATRAATGADGRFELGLAPGRWHLLVEASGFRLAELHDLSPAAGDVEVVLVRRAGLDGMVRAGGRPASGVTVQVAGASGVRTVQSGPDGAFAFPDLTEGRYALRAQRDELAAYLSAVAVGATGDAGVGVLAVELRAGVQVAGRLADRGGRALDGGEVTLVESPYGPLERRVKSGADGRFGFPGVLPGAYLISARAEGYWPAEPRALAVTNTPMAVEVKLERGATLEGRVVDEHGKPIAEARIEVSGEGAAGAPIAVTAVGLGAGPDGRLEPAGELGVLRGVIPYPPPFAAPARTGSEAARGFVSGKDGSFRLSGLPAGKLVVAASHLDFARGVSASVETRANSTATVTVTLRRGEAVRGRTVDDRGGPLSGVELADAQGALVVSDARGEFVLPHVDHELTVTAQKPGYLPLTRTVSPAIRDAGDLSLVRAEGRLGGVVVDDRGLPVAGARVDVMAKAVAPKRLITDARGRFRVDGLGPGPYRVEATHGELEPARMSDVPPGDELTITLQPGGGLDGAVRDARTGEVPRGVRLELTGLEHTMQIGVDRRGRFEAFGVPPGRVTLRASAPGYVPWTRAIDVPAAERPRDKTVRDLEVQLERGGVISGRVRDHDGEPAADAQVSAGAARGRTDGRGEFRLDGIEAGRVAVRVEAGGRQAGEEVDVRAGDESRVELRLR